MAYCRGSASLFDEWAELSGNPGLAWHSLLEDFKETSQYVYEPAAFGNLVNTTVFGAGPLEASRASGDTGFDLPFAEALQSSLGLQEVDMSDGSGIGLSFGLGSIKSSTRTRSYARNTFGSLMEHRPNVQMIHGAWVSKIGFSSKTAVNVTYLNTLNGNTQTIKAKEIVVSGGAINTPKLLLLSGVGPEDRLKTLGIPVVSDNPSVGVSLRDHHFPIVELQVTPDVLTVWQWAFNATGKAIAEQQYAANASGPLAWDNGLVYGAFRVPDSVFEGVDGSHYTSLPADRPHILIEYSTVPFYNKTGNISTITAWASLVQPEGSGYVTLNSSDFRADPLIFSNYYGSPADKAAILWGYKKLREILRSDAFSSVSLGEFYPGANVTTDAQVWTAIQQQSFSFHHPVGSVAIGKALDRNWRLKGLKGIRVVDSSTFPYPSTCHPEADVYALAHRAAKDIRKADHPY
jgi:choline dehydrogenase